MYLIETKRTDPVGGLFDENSIYLHSVFSFNVYILIRQPW